MSVPFEKLGPGQSARLAYQILGSNGPISNPSGIRYLAPGAAGLGSVLSSPAGGPASAAAAVVSAGANIANLGLGLANVALGAANLGVGLATLAGVWRLNGKVDSLIFKVDVMAERVKRIEGKVDHLIADVARMDARLEQVQATQAQTVLVNNLNFLLDRAVSDNEVNLTVLWEVASSLDIYRTDIPEAGTFGLRPDLLLTPMTRNRVHVILGLLRGARMSTWAAYNTLMLGSPDRALSDDLLIRPFLSVPDLAVSQILASRTIDDISRRVKHRVWDKTDAGRSRTRRFGYRVQEWGAPIRQSISELSSDASILADHLQPLVPKGVDTGDVVRAYLNRWMLTDAALLWKLRLELQMAANDDLWNDIAATLAVASEDRVLELEKVEAVVGYIDERAVAALPQGHSPAE